MRAFFLATILAFFAGCASEMSHADMARWATSLSVSPEGISSIVQQVRAHHRLSVVGFRRQPDGSIMVMLADRPDRPHGIFVVFREVGTEWVEDTKSQGDWIV
jgi:hypothetical protein